MNSISTSISNVYRRVFEHHDDSAIQDLLSVLRDATSEIARNPDVRTSVWQELDWDVFRHLWSEAETAILASNESPNSDIEWCLWLARFTRNLTAGTLPFQELALTAEPIMRRALYHLTSFYRMQDLRYTLCTRVFTQALSNTISSSERAQCLVWPLYMQLPQERNILVRLMASTDVATLNTTLIFVLNSTHESFPRTELLVTALGGILVCKTVLDHASATLEAPPGTDEGSTFEISYKIFRNIFQKSLFAETWVSLVGSDEPLTPHRVVFLKLLDAYLQTKGESLTLNIKIFTFLAQILSILVQCSSMSIERYLHPGQFAHSGFATDDLDHHLPILCQGIVLVSQSLSSVVLWEQVQQNAIGGLQLVKKTKLEAGLGLVESMIELLRLLNSLLPRILHGKALLTSGLEAEDKIKQSAKMMGFEYVKRDVVRLLGFVCHQDKDVQDRIRVCGGIQVVMSLCVVDERNPYLREHALLTLRNLLHENAENQKVVGDIQPVTVKGEQVLG